MPMAAASISYRRNDRLREMGLGPLLKVPLAKARELASEARAQLGAGKDPITERRVIPERIPTFGEMADDFIETMRPQFRNAKHVAQWEMTLRHYAKPLRSKAVNAIQTEDVLQVLKPIWNAKSETASRVRGRIERVLDAAKAKGHRTGENPALWRGHLANLLPRRRKLARGHHAAMAYPDVPAFIGRLREREAVAALALEFTILTAARSGETFGARWREVDPDAAVWTIPADRMKAAREHRVPLTPRALAILREVAQAGVEPDGFVFPGQKRDRPLSTMAMDMLLRRMGVDVTVHGFRSSFRDWCGEESSFPREVAEAALAHVVGDATERAYRRGDALEKRRKLMLAWAGYVEPRKPGNVVPIRPAAAA
jgi:integrase